MRTENKPLLSICIPTYNRSKYLKRSLETIVSQERFEEIEVVISDNCSLDDTKEMCESYTLKYSNIRYFRNEKNIGCGNMPVSLQRATGRARKLSNDTLIYTSGSIAFLLEIIERHLSSRELLYIINEEKTSIKQECVVRCSSIDAFLKNVSFFLTWLGAIVVWEEYCDKQCDSMQIYEENEGSNLAHVPFLISILEKNNTSLVITKKMMVTQDVEKKNLTYGIYQVFYKNFMGFMEEYENKGLISKATKDFLRKDLLLRFFRIRVAEIKINPKNYVLSDEDLFGLLKKEYGKEPYYIEYLIRLFYRMLKLKFIKNI